MNYRLLMALLFGLSLGLQAHNPLAASYYIEVNKDLSVLHIYLAQAGVEQALLQHHSSKQLSTMPPAEYKQVIVNYVRDNFSLQADQKNVTLGAGGVKLGTHQTDLKFLLEGIDAVPVELEINIPAFAENEYHQSVFSYSLYGKKGKAILSADNNYGANIILDKQAVATTFRAWALVGLLLVGTSALFFVQRRCFGVGYLHMRRYGGPYSSAVKEIIH